MYMRAFGGFPFWRLWVPNLGTYALLSEVDERDIKGQPVGGFMLRLSEDESKGA